MCLLPRGVAASGGVCSEGGVCSLEGAGIPPCVAAANNETDYNIKSSATPKGNLNLILNNLTC